MDWAVENELLLLLRNQREEIVTGMDHSGKTTLTLSPALWNILVSKHQRPFQLGMLSIPTPRREGDCRANASTHAWKLP